MYIFYSKIVRWGLAFFIVTGLYQGEVTGQVSLISNYSSVKGSNKKPLKTPEYKQAAYLYPLRSISSYIMMGYEYKVAKNQTIKFTGAISSFEGTSPYIYDINIERFSGFRTELFYKIFVGKNGAAFNGFYFAPSFMYKGCSYTYSELNIPNVIFNGTAEAYMGSLNIGYHIPLGETFTVDAFVGQSVMFSNGVYSKISRTSDIYSNSILFTGGLGIGFGF